MTASKDGDMFWARIIFSCLPRVWLANVMVWVVIALFGGRTWPKPVDEHAMRRRCCIRCLSS